MVDENSLLSLVFAFSRSSLTLTWRQLLFPQYGSLGAIRRKGVCHLELPVAKQTDRANSEVTEATVGFGRGLVVD